MDSQVPAIIAQFIEKLEKTPDDMETLITLGFILAPEKTINVNGEVLDRKRCFVKALELRPGFQLCLQLVRIMDDAETVLAFNKQWTKLELCAMAINLAPKEAAPWKELANVVKPNEGFRLTQNSRMMTRLDIHMKIVELNGKESDSWRFVGMSLLPGEKVRIGEQKYNAKACLVQAVETGPKNRAALAALANILAANKDTASINGEMWDYRRCLTQLALVTNPTDVLGLQQLADAIGSQTLEVLGLGSVSQRWCYARIAELTPTVSVWRKLASFLPPGETVTVGGITMGASHCFAKIVELQPKCAPAYIWLFHALSLEPDAAVEVNGVVWDRVHCLIRAIELAPKYAEPYGLLAQHVERGTAYINGEVWEAERIRARARELDPLLAVG